METYVLLGFAVRHPSPSAFPTYAKFKGKAVEDALVGAVPPPAGPALSSGWIPALFLLEKATPGAQWGEIGSVLDREACSTCLAQVLAPAALKGREEAPWATSDTSALPELTCALDKTLLGLLGRAASFSMHLHLLLITPVCCREKFSQLLCRRCYI